MSKRIPDHLSGFGTTGDGSVEREGSSGLGTHLAPGKTQLSVASQAGFEVIQHPLHQDSLLPEPWHGRWSWQRCRGLERHSLVTPLGELGFILGQ